MRPGTQRTLRFDRPFKRIEIESDPPDAIDVEWAGNQNFTVLKAQKHGRAELLVFGEDGPNGKRDILLSATVTSSIAPVPPKIIPTPMPNTNRVQVHNKKSLTDNHQFDCTGAGCTQR
jgi:hypothetical protein